jgi:hypothetical protein
LQFDGVCQVFGTRQHIIDIKVAFCNDDRLWEILLLIVSQLIENTGR